ncbi:hypothetical protein ABZY90_16545 [Streptomyces sp. NPDC006422]|uniref:hypothetical protein n=1 Tax=unclassified Streptomyces TaxID=2593676 RepID=UPI0033AA376E
MNPVLALPALRTAFENPPALLAATAVSRRPFDIRRTLFAAASRPSSRWGA